MSKHSRGSKSVLLRLKLNLLGSLSYIVAGWLGKIDDNYSATYLQVHGSKRLNEVLFEETRLLKERVNAKK